MTPATKCKLRLLQLESMKDSLSMEEEFITNQEQLKPQEDKNEEDWFTIDDSLGLPMIVGNLEKIIDENHGIVLLSMDPKYHVNILSLVETFKRLKK